MSAVTEAVPIVRWIHWCPHADSRAGAPIDENDPDLIHCRCFTGHAFFAAQDAMAVKLDAERVAR